MRTMPGMGRRAAQQEAAPYIASTYRPTRAVESLHAYPRSGRPTVPVYLNATSTEQDRSDYFFGITSGSFVIFLGFLIWATLLILLKFAGPRRVGCASGYPQRPRRPVGLAPGVDAGEAGGGVTPSPASRGRSSPSRSPASDITPQAGSPRGGGGTSMADGGRGGGSSHDVAAARYLRDLGTFRRRSAWTRVGFLASGAGLVVATALFYAGGVAPIRNAVRQARGGMADVEKLLADAGDATSGYLEDRGMVGTEAENLRYSALEFCDLSLLDDLDVDRGLRDELWQRYINLIESMWDVGQLEGISETETKDEFANLNEGLEGVAADVASTNRLVTGWYQWVLWGAVAVVGLQTLLCVCFMWEVLATGFGVKTDDAFVRCVRNGIIMPLFSFFSILSWLFATMILFGAISASDICIDPDGNMRTALAGLEGEKKYSTALFSYLNYFIDCDNTTKPELIPATVNRVSSALNSVQNMTEYFATETDMIVHACGRTGADLFGRLTTVVHDDLHALNDIALGSVELLQCSNFNSVYTDTAHKALCVDVFDGLVWTFSTQLAIAICAMTMITLRAARWNVDKDLRRTRPNANRSPKRWGTQPRGGTTSSVSLHLRRPRRNSDNTPKPPGAPIVNGAAAAAVAAGEVASAAVPNGDFIDDAPSSFSPYAGEEGYQHRLDSGFSSDSTFEGDPLGNSAVEDDPFGNSILEHDPLRNSTFEDEYDAL